jgi:hypothetical protein
VFKWVWWLAWICPFFFLKQKGEFVVLQAEEWNNNGKSILDLDGGRLGKQGVYRLIYEK